MIVVKNLSKKYKKSEEFAVKEVSFSVDDGELFAFLGPNGAGKTTTISILTTTLAKTSGKVEVAGVNLDDDPAKIREQIGIIFQKPSLDENLTAEENVRFHAALYGVHEFKPFYKMMDKDYRQKISELAEVLSLDGSMDKPVKSFSGGMKRKLEIVRSLLHSPKILFLDEPTTGLDPEARKSLWKYIRRVQNEKGTTIFLTTHYLEEAEGADQVVIINNGEIAASGTPLQLKQNLVKEELILETDDSQELESLKKELSGKKIDFHVRGASGRQLVVDLKRRNAYDLIKQINTRIARMDITRPTLEDAYLTILES